MVRSTSGVASAGVRRVGFARFLPSAALALVLIGMLYVVLTNAEKLPWGLWLGALLVLPVIINAIAESAEKQVGQTTKGAEDVKDVASVLAGLDDCFHVVHDVALTAGGIDHVVVGPTGIYTIQAQSHCGQVTFDGHRLLLDGSPLEADYLSKAYAEAMTVKEYLRNTTGVDVHVSPVLVFTRAFVKVRGMARGVDVVPARWINDCITQRTEHLDEMQCARLAGTIVAVTDYVPRRA